MLIRIFVIITVLACIPALATDYCQIFLGLLKERKLVKQTGRLACTLACATNILQILRIRQGESALPRLDQVGKNLLNAGRSQNLVDPREGIKPKDVKPFLELALKEHHLKGKVDVVATRHLAGLAKSVEDLPPSTLELDAAKDEIKFLFVVFWLKGTGRIFHHTAILLKSEKDADGKTTILLSDPEEPERLVTAHPIPSNRRDGSISIQFDGLEKRRFEDFTIEVHGYASIKPE